MDGKILLHYIEKYLEQKYFITLAKYTCYVHCILSKGIDLMSRMVFFISYICYISCKFVHIDMKQFLTIVISISDRIQR